MSKFSVNNITSKQGQQGPVLAGVTTMSSTGSMRIPSGPTEHRGGRGRGIIGGGAGVTMNYITIATTGNALDFGDTVNQARDRNGVAVPTLGFISCFVLDDLSSSGSIGI